MELHSLKALAKKSVRRVGRGGKRGKTSGRGGKGQTARAGNKRRPEWRDIIKKIPKRRGYGRNRADSVIPQGRGAVVDLATLNKHFKSGDVVTPASLVARGLIRRVSGKIPPIKVLGKGTLEAKLVLKGLSVSASAKEMLEKKGGSVKGS